MLSCHLHPLITTPASIVVATVAVDRSAVSLPPSPRSGPVPAHLVHALPACVLDFGSGCPSFFHHPSDGRVGRCRPLHLMGQRREFETVRKAAFGITTMVCSCLLGFGAYGSYQCTDDQGHTSFQDRPCTQQQSRKLAGGARIDTLVVDRQSNMVSPCTITTVHVGCEGFHSRQARNEA